ncbi:D-alanine--D-alanine ligase [Maritimibacter sp. DP1N21-5]|uniref:D-alanine--D-alanine ligase n=1 Tax=Maritimibacter sp. DP1N21-5 TaxID=2836867 RepID=UPI001C46A080|nr:D-alanine--D-alanine ligase [Maritimibacter sp. DP1N21-5]
MGDASRQALKVAVLKGGPSAEREVSLSSGRECAAALRGEGYEVVELDAGPDLVTRLSEISPDVVFNALHGRWGEDGCVQGILEWLKIPYTHSGVLASSMAMDKEVTKVILRNAGLPLTASVLARKAEIEAAHVMDPPYVVKPFNEGSSVGVYIVNEGANTPPKLSDDMPERLMVEAYIPGRELTTTVMGDRALGVTDIISDGWYDYHAKYSVGGSRHEIPADIPAAITEACLDYALRAHEALGCRGISRTDFRWDEAMGLDGLIILEVNTQPGMTPTSLAPEQAAHAGLTFGQFCRWLVEDASCNR